MSEYDAADDSRKSYDVCIAAMRARLLSDIRFDIRRRVAALVAEFGADFLGLDKDEVIDLITSFVIDENAALRAEVGAW